MCHSRPDIVYAIHKLLQYSSRTCKQHWKAALRIVGYIAGMIHYGLVWGGGNPKARGLEDIKYYNIDHVIETHDGSSKLDKFRVFADINFAGDSTTK